MTFHRSVVVAVLSFGLALPLRAADSAGEREALLLPQVMLLNQIPELQLSDKVDPGFSLLRTIYDKDAPDFLTLRKILGKATVRAELNPSVRCLLAGVISQRWDTFTLSGNLYLAGLKSANPDLRDKARHKLVSFIQPAHIPVLIDLLKVPGPNVLAYEILQEVTGERLDPNITTWRTWWVKTGSKHDLVDHLIADTQNQLSNHRVHAFDQRRFWYVPDGIRDSQTPYARRSENEQREISDWNNWVNTEVKKSVEDWAIVKPSLDRLIHQPHPHVNAFLETLVSNPGIGDYASVVLAWRTSVGSLASIQAAYTATPTVGRALARGSLGDTTALDDLLGMLDEQQQRPLSYKIMDDDARGMLSTLRTVGVVSAEQAFELLTHTNFEFESATTTKDKKKAFKKAKTWLHEHRERLTLDRRRGYYLQAAPEK